MLPIKHYIGEENKNVFAQEKNYVMNMEFLQLSSVDNYNDNIYEVDIANQKRDSYYPD